MQISDLFIRRPVFSVVVSLLLMVGGFASLARLPVREYPAVDPPVVSVSTVYRGASNQVVESRITEIIEGAVAGLEGIREIRSSSQNDRSSVNIEFQLSRNQESAAADVRDAVSRVLGRLPDGIDPPVIRKVDANSGAIMWVARHFLDPRPARAERLPQARLCRPPVDRAGRRQRLYRRRAPLRHAHLDRPRRPRRARPHRAGRGDGDPEAERGAARRAPRIDAARADGEDRLAPGDAGGIPQHHRRQQERLPRAARRGGARRGRRRGQPLRVLSGRPHRHRPRHRAAIDRQHPRGGGRRAGRAGKAQGGAAARNGDRGRL